MLGSIGDTLSSFTGNFVGNLLDRLMDLAPDLLTGALATAANSVLPGSGALVQAFAGPIVQAGVQAFESAFQDVLMPAASQALADADVPDTFLANRAHDLAGIFLGGVQQGISG
jgi:hypothetical protein